MIRESGVAAGRGFWHVLNPRSLPKIPFDECSMIRLDCNLNHSASC
jgi:hypothetical protein